MLTRARLILRLPLGKVRLPLLLLLLHILRDRLRARPHSFADFFFAFSFFFNAFLSSVGLSPLLDAACLLQGSLPLTNTTSSPPPSGELSRSRFLRSFSSACASNAAVDILRFLAPPAPAAAILLNSIALVLEPAALAPLAAAAPPDGPSRASDAFASRRAETCFGCLPFAFASAARSPGAFGVPPREPRISFSRAASRSLEAVDVAIVNCTAL